MVMVAAVESIVEPELIADALIPSVADEFVPFAADEFVPIELFVVLYFDLTESFAKYCD